MAAALGTRQPPKRPPALTREWAGCANSSSFNSFFAHQFGLLADVSPARVNGAEFFKEGHVHLGIMPVQTRIQKTTDANIPNIVIIQDSTHNKLSKSVQSS